MQEQSILSSRLMMEIKKALPSPGRAFFAPLLHLAEWKSPGTGKKPCVGAVLYLEQRDLSARIAQALGKLHDTALAVGVSVFAANHAVQALGNIAADGLIIQHDAVQ